MLLLSVREWFATTKKGDLRPTMDSNEIESYVTYLPLAEAIEHLRSYQYAWREKSKGKMTTDYTLLSVTEIDELSLDLMNFMRITYIDDLPTSVEELED